MKWTTSLPGVEHGRVEVVLPACACGGANLEVLYSASGFVLTVRLLDEAREAPRPSGSGMSVEQLCATLGVRYPPVASEVNAAFRLFCRNAHPDKEGTGFVEHGRLWQELRERGRDAWVGEARDVA